jgi:hypothetical protein
VTHTASGHTTIRRCSQMGTCSRVFRPSTCETCRQIVYNAPAQVMRANEGATGQPRMLRSRSCAQTWGHQVGLECSGIQVSSRGTRVRSRSGPEFGGPRSRYDKLQKPSRKRVVTSILCDTCRSVLWRTVKTFEETCSDLAALRYMSIGAPANSENLRGNVFRPRCLAIHVDRCSGEQ